MWVIGKGIEWQGRISARPWQTALLAATAPPAFGARWPAAGRRPCLVYAIPFGHRRQSRPYHVVAGALLVRKRAGDAVEARSSPSDESCFSTRKKAVACPTPGAPGTPCVSRVAVSGCIVPPCPIVDLPGRTRTPNVTDKNNTRAGSREHSQGGTDTVSGPSSMLAPREAFDRLWLHRVEHIQ